MFVTALTLGGLLQVVAAPTVRAAGAAASNATSSCPHPGGVLDPDLQEQSYENHQVTVSYGVSGVECWNNHKVWEGTPLNMHTINPLSVYGCFADFIGISGHHPAGVTLSVYYCGTVDNDTTKMYQAINVCVQYTPAAHMGYTQDTFIILEGRYDVNDHGVRSNYNLSKTSLVYRAGHCPTGAAVPDGTYRGRGYGVDASQNTVSLTVAPDGLTVPTYDFRIDTFCGKDNVGGNDTEFWPFTNRGSPALVVGSTGTFSSSQRGAFTVPVIPRVTSTPEPGTYSFSVSGAFYGKTFAGRVTLWIRTRNHYFCSAVNRPFKGTRLT